MPTAKKTLKPPKTPKSPTPATAKATAPATADVLDFDTLPGHGIRRLQQIAVAVFLEETEASGITPVQFAALQATANQPGLDQRTLAATIGLDTSTVAGVVDRLEARGLLLRQLSPSDRRVRLLTLTPDGHATLRDVVPAMLRAQARILAPLSETEQRTFLRLLTQLVDSNNGLSRAPAEG